MGIQQIVFIQLQNCNEIQVLKVSRRGVSSVPMTNPLENKELSFNIIYTGSTNAWLFAKVWQICQNVKNYNFCVLKS